MDWSVLLLGRMPELDREIPDQRYLGQHIPSHRQWSEKRDVMAKAIFERIDADRDGCLTTREFGLIKYQKPIPVR